MAGFVREYQILARLDHPNILNIREIWEWNKMLFIVTEFCDGGDLFSYMLERNKIHEVEMATIMRQLLGCLNYLAEQGICHRDIKLENIMLQNEKDVSIIKLIDFGLSKDLKAGKQKSLVSGTPFYIAPEVINRIVTPASDIWSAGVVMYVCLTGRLPFPGNDIDEIFHAILNKDIGAYLNTHFGHLSSEVKDIMNHCLNKNHMERISASDAYHHTWFD